VTTPALVIEQPERNPLTDLARRHGVRIVDRFDLACTWQQSRRDGFSKPIAFSSIPSDVLDIFEGRSLNFHPGLLPEYAGLHTHQ
jgi:methionyl-tRNA formyltransferase